MTASLIPSPFWGQSAFRLSATTVSMSLAGSCFSFGNRHQGPSIIGFEDEVETIFWGDLAVADSRSKRTLRNSTSSHRPARDIISTARLELECPSYGVNPARGPYAAATFPWSSGNSVPSTHMRCMITAKRARQRQRSPFIPAEPGDLSSPRP